jgi:hypothetical protein
MIFEKQIFQLFKMNRSEFNRFDRNCERVLMHVFEMGKKEGKKEMKKSLEIVLKNEIKL